MPYQTEAEAHAEMIASPYWDAETGTYDALREAEDRDFAEGRLLNYQWQGEDA